MNTVTLMVKGGRVAFLLLFFGAGLMPTQLRAGGSGAFEQTGSLATPRSSHSATMLPNGKVLVAGLTLGESTELYDNASGTWTETGNLAVNHWSFTATLLPNGKVLAAGGQTVIEGDMIVGSAECELYDPTNGTWTPTGSLGHARFSHTATLLPDGKVLVAGGFNEGNVPSAELYDPVTGTWTTTGSPAIRRHTTATLLPNGKVLIVGGRTATGVVTSATELYDPASGTWTSTGSLTTARDQHTATLLPNGLVLVAGGFGGTGSLFSAELYDPTSGAWTSTGSLAAARENSSATLLSNGEVLVVGGLREGPGGAVLESAELYDPANGTWSATGSLAAARVQHTATLLPNGQVLAAGGVGSTRDNGERGIVQRATCRTHFAQRFYAAGGSHRGLGSHRRLHCHRNRSQEGPGSRDRSFAQCGGWHFA